MTEKPLAYRGDEPFVFVSYAHADAEQVYPLIAGLQERGLRIWFDDGLEAGDIWDDVIPDHVERCSAVLCLVSRRFTDSENCLDEIHYAKERKKELVILHLENQELPRKFQFSYGRLHALWRSDYSDRSDLLDELASTSKLRCCMGVSQRSPAQPEMSPEELCQKGRKAYYGRGVPKSYVEAAKWYRRAADQGNARAMCNLGICYYKGQGVPWSYEEAVEWYCRAADQGNARAMCNLGVCYETGKGVPQSWALAVVWYRRAADKGDALAMSNLGSCYAYGRGVVKDQAQADYWRKKAEQARV